MLLEFTNFLLHKLHKLSSQTFFFTNFTNFLLHKLHKLSFSRPRRACSKHLDPIFAFDARAHRLSVTQIALGTIVTIGISRNCFGLIFDCSFWSIGAPRPHLCWCCLSSQAFCHYWHLTGNAFIGLIITILIFCSSFDPSQQNGRHQMDKGLGVEIGSMIGCGINCLSTIVFKFPSLDHGIPNVIRKTSTTAVRSALFSVFFLQVMKWSRHVLRLEYDGIGARSTTANCRLPLVGWKTWRFENLEVWKFGVWWDWSRGTTADCRLPLVGLRTWRFENLEVRKLGVWWDWSKEHYCRLQTSTSRLENLEVGKLGG